MDFLSSASPAKSDSEYPSISKDSDFLYVSMRPVVPRVNQTGGNRSGLTGYRSNRSGPVPVWAGTKPAQIQNSKFKFEFKKMKNSQKIPKNTLRCDKSNGVKFSQKFVHL